MSFRPNEFQKNVNCAVFEACTSLQLNQFHECYHAPVRAAGMHLAGRLLKGAFVHLEAMCKKHHGAFLT